MKPYKVTLRDRQDKALVFRALERCPWGYTVLFKPPTRSNEQNKRLWAFLDDIAEQKDWHGRKLTSDDWKSLFSACLRGQELVPNLDNNGFVALGARTSEMSPEEMGDLLQLIETWGVQNGVTFTDPDSPEVTATRNSGARAGAADGKVADASARNLSEREP